MAFHWWYIVVAVVAVLAWPPKWDPAILIKERQIRRGEHPEARRPGDPERWRDFITAAEADQRKADYPGCERGFMACRDQVCMCREDRPCWAFVLQRAKALAREAEETQS
jgi:hypothetical protein